MSNFRVKFPPDARTASQAYDHYMRTGNFLAAAQVAAENGLREEDIRHAAFLAACMFISQRDPEAAAAVKERYGLSDPEAEDIANMYDLYLQGNLPPILAHACAPRGPGTA